MLDPMKYRIMLFRAMTVSIILASIVVIYVLNLHNEISVSLEENVTVEYSVNPVFFPGQTARFDWHVEHIVAVYFNQGGVIGQDFRLKTVELCELNKYTLDITLSNSQEVSYNLQPNIFIFDPLFVSLLILLLIQCFYLISQLSNKLGYSIVPIVNSANIIRTVLKQCALIGFSFHIILPIVALSLKTVACI